MKKNKVTLWERYLTKEIGIEFKACLYFFAILFFYCVYRLIQGTQTADIWHMTEMIFTCYIIGYLQVYVFWDFDEAEHLGTREILGMVICTGLYLLVSYIGKWLDRNLPATGILAVYLLFTYWCVYFIYKTKRRIDDKKLNEDLRLFQSEHKKSES
ncbi:MAG: DUF3021 family protein [Lachnospiraceae bacterium]|nr:DUF3021 family protein [Lachnospiraceae bacterium]